MKLENTTSFPVATMLGDGPNDTPCLTIIIKGTFVIRAGALAALAPKQLPILTADEFYDDDEIESVRFESDMAPYKPRADIVLVGRAYTPQAKPVTVLDVSLRVGNVFKQLRVFGDRSWIFPSRLALAPAISDPLPFSVMDLVYDRAFGGIDHEGGQWCKENLIGKGFIAKKKKDSIHEIALPNLEAAENSEQRIESWKSRPMPVGFGFYSKQWLPRAALIGVVDETWVETRAPKMPEGFSFAFYNAAHPDLQAADYLRGDESVELLNLSPHGKLNFFLPGIRPIVTVVSFKESPQLLLESLTTETAEDEAEPTMTSLEDLPTRETVVTANLDTVCLIPDEGRFYLVWRAVFPIHDLETIAVNIAGIRIAGGRLDERRTPVVLKLSQPQSPGGDLPSEDFIEIGLLESTQTVPVETEDVTPELVASANYLTEATETSEHERHDSKEPGAGARPETTAVDRTDALAHEPSNDQRVIEIGLLESTQTFSGEALARTLAAKAAAGERGQLAPPREPAAEGHKHLSGGQEERQGAAKASKAPAVKTPQHMPVVIEEPQQGAPPQALNPKRPRVSGDPLERQIMRVAMVYRQRLGQFAAGDATWESLAEQEQRLRAVADALKNTQPSDVRRLLALLAEKKMDRIFAAAFALLAISAERFFPAVIAKTAGAAPETIGSFVEAVRLANISAIDRLLTPHLGAADPTVQRFLLEVIGDRRAANQAGVEFVGKCLLGLNKDVTLAALKAQARLRSPDFLVLIRRLALSSDPEIQDAALLDLLLAGKHEAFRVLRRLCNMGTKSGSLRYIYLAFNGAKADVPLLAKHTHEPLALLGLGILGFPEAAPILIKLLNSNYPMICQAASHALQLITGTVLADAGDSNRRTWCLSAERWLKWWDENNTKFSAGVRWRRGKAFNPGRCINQLADCTLSLRERTWAYQELVVSTGQDFAFEPDWLVHEQRAAIHAWEAWWLNRGKMQT